MKALLNKMNSKINETECCVCFTTAVSHTCKICVGSICHECYCELEYSEPYSLVDCPICRTPMITDFISVRFIDLIQDGNFRNNERNLPVIQILLRNVRAKKCV